MRFGRTAQGHNIMRFGRAGHNIMHFGKRGGSNDDMLLSEALNEAYNDPDSSVDIPLSNLYVNRVRQSPWSKQYLPVTNPSSNHQVDFFLPSIPTSPTPTVPSVMMNPNKKSIPSSLSEMLFAPPNASSSLARRVLMPHLFLSSFYSPYFNRRIPLYNYNKKADRERDNVFMHFG